MSQVVFNYTGSTQSWTVPPGVVRMQADVLGGIGPAAFAPNNLAGLLWGTIIVTQGDVITFDVGAASTGGAGGTTTVYKNGVLMIQVRGGQSSFSDPNPNTYSTHPTDVHATQTGQFFGITPVRHLPASGDGRVVIDYLTVPTRIRRVGQAVGAVWRGSDPVPADPLPVPVPAGLEAGDVLVTCVTGSLSAPEWTDIVRTSGLIVVAAYHVVTAADVVAYQDPNFRYVLTGASNGSFVGTIQWGIIGLRGVDTSHPVVATSTHYVGVSGGGLITPSITMPVDGCYQGRGAFWSNLSSSSPRLGPVYTADGAMRTEGVFGDNADQTYSVAASGGWSVGQIGFGASGGAGGPASNYLRSTPAGPQGAVRFASLGSFSGEAAALAFGLRPAS